MISCKSSSSLINYYLCALFCDECSQRENTNKILAKCEIEEEFNFESFVGLCDVRKSDQIFFLQSNFFFLWVFLVTFQKRI